jgi:hypothetical protein
MSLTHGGSGFQSFLAFSLRWPSTRISPLARDLRPEQKVIAFSKIEVELRGSALGVTYGQLFKPLRRYVTSY